MSRRPPHQRRGPSGTSVAPRRVALVVCDSLGIGEAPDAARYGDEGANTLARVAAAVGGLFLPTLERWGIGRLAHVAGVPPIARPEAVVARVTPTAAGKDSTTGHWELMGYRTERPFPTYPDGFPPEIIEAFSTAIGRGVLANRPASGTVIIEELGEEHLETGKPIVYTSADSVFQVAAHLEVVRLEELYVWCGRARQILTGKHGVARVIARPFAGEPRSFRRTSGRRDFSLPPPDRTACDVLHASGVAVKAVGKIEDLFAGRGITCSSHTADNEASLEASENFLREDAPALVFANDERATSPSIRRWDLRCSRQWGTRSGQTAQLPASTPDPLPTRSRLSRRSSDSWSSERPLPKQHLLYSSASCPDPTAMGDHCRLPNPES